MIRALTLPDQLSRSLSSSGLSGTAGDSSMLLSEMAASVHHPHAPFSEGQVRRERAGGCGARGAIRRRAWGVQSSMLHALAMSRCTAASLGAAVEAAADAGRLGAGAGGSGLVVTSALAGRKPMGMDLRLDVAVLRLRTHRRGSGSSGVSFPSMVSDRRNAPLVVTAQSRESIRCRHRLNAPHSAARWTVLGGFRGRTWAAWTPPPPQATPGCCPRPLRWLSPPPLLGPPLPLPPLPLPPLQLPPPPQREVPDEGRRRWAVRCPTPPAAFVCGSDPHPQQLRQPPVLESGFLTMKADPRQ